MKKLNQTHSKVGNSFATIVYLARKRIMSRSDLPYISVEKQLEILEELCSFPLGKFFLERKGADGYWTDYIINYPNREKLKTRKSIDHSLSPTEKFILYNCPLTIATRERFKIFQTSAQKFLKDNSTIASIPCGVMRDLLTLDFSNFSGISLIGIDLDPKSLHLAMKLAKKQKVDYNLTLAKGNAWHLEYQESIDLITSNGLNVYVSDIEKVQSLYKTFYKALKKNGVLIIGVLTYPPDHSNRSEWRLEGLPIEDILFEKILFHDILDCKWRNFRTLDQINEDFSSVGFSKVEVIFDKHRIFPTVIAIK